MRARMAVLVSGLSCDIREVKLSAKPAEMIAASPKATVPVLLLPDGRVIDESLDIMRWALGRNDPEQWLDGDDADLIAANDGPFKHHLDRYKYPDRQGADPAEHRAAGMAMLGHLETRLAAAANLCGARRSITDIALMPFVRQFAEVSRPFFDAQPIQGVQRWLAAHIASPLFEQAMIRLVPWKAGDPPILFPASGREG
jgi:glutathione S-transferase